MNQHLYLFAIPMLLNSVLASASTPLPQVTPIPVFLKLGFSAVLEFEEAPVRVVLGDSQAFQVERLDKSLVLRTLVAYATTNMFVYFKTSSTQLFVLLASDEAEPTYIRKIQTLSPVQPTKAPSSTSQNPSVSKSLRSSHVVSAKFDTKKDYLTVEVILRSQGSVMRPKWSNVQLKHQARFQSPYKLWSERKEVQRDTSIRSRFIFVKPNVPRDLKDVALIIPIEGQLSPLVLDLKRGRP